MKIGIIVSNFNREITSRMQDKAIKESKKLNLQIAKLIIVPGVFEIPLIAKRLLQNKAISGIVALGAVVQGETYHDIIVVETASRSIMNLSLEYNKPIGFGIIGPRVSWKQASKRADEYAERAVKSLDDMLKFSRKLG